MFVVSILVQGEMALIRVRIARLARVDNIPLPVEIRPFRLVRKVLSPEGRLEINTSPEKAYKTTLFELIMTTLGDIILRAIAPL